MGACSPQDDYSLGNVGSIAADQISFTQTPSSTSPNLITFTNTTNVNGIYNVMWDLGNGTKGTGQSIIGAFPYAGDYNVVITVHAADGTSATKSQVVHVAANDFSLINTPNYIALTGGMNATEGKTWVFDQYHDGHFGVGPDYQTWPEWWAAKANDKEGTALYAQKFTFYQAGTKLKWENNGYIYANRAGVEALGKTVEDPDVIQNKGDYDVPYTTKADGYTFIFDETTMTMTLSDKAFFGFYAGTTQYQILSLSENEMFIKGVSIIEPWSAWFFRLIPEELNIAPPPVIKENKVLPLAENFEAEPYKVTFQYETMGDLTTPGYANPAPVPINQSKKVFLYQKSDAFYSNVFWVASDYKFDLTTQNKIKLKVFLPSYNDYTTDNATAGPWIWNSKLQKKIAVKLQDSGLGGDAWTTQTEIVKDDLATDKWLDLVFDFSSVADRKDYDKIVIQFGGEGHAGAGIFFFDDFSFTE